jgi:hypothetical protein
LQPSPQLVAVVETHSVMVRLVDQVVALAPRQATWAVLEQVIKALQVKLGMTMATLVVAVAVLVKLAELTLMVMVGMVYFQELQEAL